MTASEGLSPSLEDYLEVIFHLVRENKVARAKDIARRMKVTKSSVTGALRHLAEKGMVHYDPYSFVTLTAQGKARARGVVDRHRILSEFLKDTLGLSAKAAEDNACRMEHAVDDQVLGRLVQFIDFLWSLPLGDKRRGFCQNHPIGGKSQERKHQPAASRACGDGGASMEAVTLDTLEPGQKGRVLRVKGGGEISRRIVEMGLVRDTIVEVERVAPLGDPVEFKLKGYHLSLRREEALGIWVEPL